LSLIPIADGFGLNIQAGSNPASALTKYFQQPIGLTVLQHDLASVQNVPLTGFPFKSAEIGLAFTQPTAVASTSPQFAGSAAASGTLCVVTGGKLFDPDPCGSPIDVPSGHAYLGVGVKIALAPGVSIPAGKLAFGFTAGSTVTMTHYQPFPTSATTPTFRNALQAAVENYLIPLTPDDLFAMGAGDVAIIEGAGSIKVSGTFNLLTAVNPLVSISSAALPATIQVKGGATICVSATCTITGDLQIRVQRVNAGTVRLGLYRKRGAEFSVQVEPSVGLTAGTSSTDFISAVLGAIGPTPFPAAEQLEKAGLSRDKQDAIVSALKAGVQRSLALSIQAELHALGSEEVAFMYEVSLSHLGTEARNAIQDALKLNLSALSESASLPQGITELQSLLTSTRKKGHTLKLNLLGIYNFASLSELTLKGTVLADPASGEVLITDAATATRVAGTVNFLADSDKLRKALAQSFLLTAAYRCTGLIGHAPSLKVSYWHFADHARTDRDIMGANLRALTSLKLITEVEEEQHLAGVENSGQSTFYLNTDYDDALSQNLFINNSDGKPRGLEEYEGIGRAALRSLILPDGDDAFRLLALKDDAKWQEVKETGGTLSNLAPIFPNLRPDSQIPVIAGDYLVIEWWATTMSHMAQSLSAARSFFSQNPAPATNSPAFEKVQNNLWHQMAAVAANTHDRFADPWGLLAVDLVSGQQSAASARLISAGLTLILQRN
jgi:hypothetical protein